ncbi:AlpA family phage regulatory protein [Luteimonas marina]|uniref:AlpA family phage regulatory protein n=1 Tax=Luteimonas marina TaxID=488485 RepID=A0A5C5UDI2_9GAMM|nr:AlpA family phage regulatory protein [Luteimonas marina]TWT23600.1 AlpA family phage regulatory protein [Luteimonas marina]
MHSNEVASQATPAAVIPETGLMRIRQILGDKKRQLPAIIPVSMSTWYAGIKDGRYPRPVRLGRGSVAWRAEDIRRLVEQGVAVGGARG